MEASSAANSFCQYLTKLRMVSMSGLESGVWLLVAQPLAFTLCIHEPCESHGQVVAERITYRCTKPLKG